MNNDEKTDLVFYLQPNFEFYIITYSAETSRSTNTEAYYLINY